MDTPTRDTDELYDDLIAVTDLIRARTKRMYKEAEVLWRLSAKQAEVVRQIAEQRHPEEGTHHGSS